MRAARAPRESIVLVSMIADLASECAVVAPDELAALVNVIAPGKTGAF